MAGPVEQQVAAYNAHDLDGFLACFAEDVVVTAPDGTVQMDGKEVMRSRYGVMFEGGEVQAEILERLRCGRWVIDHEHVTRGEQALDVLVAYEVADGRIIRMITFS